MAITKVPFKFVTTFNSGASGFTASNLDLISTNMGARLTNFYQFFKKWRIASLSVKAFVDSQSVANISAGSAGVTIATGYMGSALANITAVPTTISEIATFLRSDLGDQTIGFRVPGKELYEARNADWIITSGMGSPPTTDYSQGTVFTALQIGQTLTTGSIRVYVIYTGVAEYCEPTTPTVALHAVHGAVQCDVYHIDGTEEDDDQKSQFSKVD